MARPIINPEVLSEILSETKEIKRQTLRFIRSGEQIFVASGELETHVELLYASKKSKENIQDAGTLYFEVGNDYAYIFRGDFSRSLLIGSNEKEQDETVRILTIFAQAVLGFGDISVQKT